MATQTRATADIEKWLRIWVRFFPNFWLQVRKKNAESRQSRLRCQAKFLTSAKFLTFFCFSVILLIKIKT